MQGGQRWDSVLCPSPASHAQRRPLASCRNGESMHRELFLLLRVTELN